MNITYKGVTYTDKHMLAVHALNVAQMVGNSSYAALDYSKDINALVAWLVVLGADIDDVRAMTLSDLLGCLVPEDK